MTTDSMMNRVRLDVAKQKEEWIVFWLKKLLPPVYFRYKVHPELFSIWLHKRHIYLAEKFDEPGVTILMQGQTPIARFRVII